ncbi:MAG: type IV pilus modification protein PilV [Ramlibacter sp.]
MNVRKPSLARSGGKSQLGFSLVESLVAIVVMAFGLLAVVGVQMEAMRGNQQTAQTAIATSLVRDYQELLTGIPSVAASGGTSSKVVSIVDNVYVAYGGAAECKGTGATCTNTQFADFHIREWINRVSQSLPGGRVSVCFDSAYKETAGAGIGLYKWACDNAGDVMVVKIGWDVKLSRSSNGTVRETGLTDGTDRPQMVVPVTGNQEGYHL